jgi:hypothetical protein
LERIGDAAVMRPGTPLSGVAALEFSSTVRNDPFQVGIQAGCFNRGAAILSRRSAVLGEAAAGRSQP